MRVLVFALVVVAVAVLVAGLQALAGLVRDLPLEPRAGRSRSVLRVASQHPARSTSSIRVRRPAGGSGAGTDELHQLEVFAERALGGEASAVERLARRVEVAAEACGLPVAAVPASAHNSVPELVHALDRVDQVLRRR